MFIHVNIYHINKFNKKSQTTLSHSRHYDKLNLKLVPSMKPCLKVAGKKIRHEVKFLIQVYLRIQTKILEVQSKSSSYLF